MKLSSRNLLSFFVGASLLVAFLAMFRSLMYGVDHYPLWIDEWLTLSAFTRDYINLLEHYSFTAGTPFPLYFLLTKPWADLSLAVGWNANWVARSGTLALTAAIFMTWCFAAWRADDNRITSFLFSAGLALLAASPSFGQHVIEARWYGLMALASIAAISLSYVNPLLVAALGAFLLLLHPFGALAGLPLMIAPFGIELASGRPLQKKALRIASIACLTLLALLAFYYSVHIKFLAVTTQEVGTTESAGSLVSLAGHVDRHALWLATFALLSAFTFLRYDKLRSTLGQAERSGGTLLKLSALSSWAAIIAAVWSFILLAPHIPVSATLYGRYVEWLNPSLWLIGGASLFLLVLAAGAQILRGEFGAISSRVLLPIVTVMLAILTTRAVLHSLPGPRHALGLDQAASFVSLFSGSESVIVTNGQPIINLPAKLSVGHPCGKSAQIVGYLDRRARSQVLCDGGHVNVSQEDEVWLVSEPTAWIGNRSIELGSLNHLSALRFGQTGVDVYVDEVPGTELEVSDWNAFDLPEYDEGTILVAVQVARGMEPGRMAEDVTLLGVTGGSGIHGKGFSLYHDARWVEDPSPHFAVVFSHDGYRGQYGVGGRSENYFFERLNVRRCGEHDVSVFGLSWRKAKDSIGFRMGLRNMAASRNWATQAWLLEALGDAKQVSLPHGEMTSSFPMRKVIFLPRFVDGVDDATLRRLYVRANGGC